VAKVLFSWPKNINYVTHIMKKQTLRDTLKQKRGAIISAQEKSFQIYEGLLILLDKKFSGLNSIFIYESFGSEVCTKDIIKTALAKRMQVSVPKVDANYNMSAVDYISRNAVSIAPQIAIVPMLGFNSSLHRIGYGKGCYDKYFAQSIDVVKIGLAFSEQRCNFAPDPCDIPLDYIVTPVLTYHSESDFRQI